MQYEFRNTSGFTYREKMEKDLSLIHILTRYDNDYQNAKESLEGLQNIVFIAIAVVSVICFLVLALFLTLRLRGRIHETGVYLAMGISKGSVLLQYLLEVRCV